MRDFHFTGNLDALLKHKPLSEVPYKRRKAFKQERRQERRMASANAKLICIEEDSRILAALSNKE